MALKLVIHPEYSHTERNWSRMLAALAEMWTGDFGEMAEAMGVIRRRAKSMMVDIDHVQGRLDALGEPGAKQAKRD